MDQATGYFHSSFACLAAFNIFGPMFGLPFVTGSLPHSPQFVLSLAERDEEQQITHVRENRLAPLLCPLPASNHRNALFVAFRNITDHMAKNNYHL